MANLATLDWYGGDAETTKDPYAFLRLAREQGPVYHEPRSGVFMVLGHDEVTRVARDVNNFSSFNTNTGPVCPFKPTSGGDMRAELAAYRQAHPELDIPPVNLDPPEHNRMRTLCLKLFSPSRVTRHAPRIGEIADSMLDEIAPASRCEWISEVAHPLALGVFSDLYGIPADDEQAFRQSITDMLKRRDASQPDVPQDSWTPVAPGPEEMEWMLTEMQRSREYFERHLAERRACPTDDLMSDFANTPYFDTDSGELPPVEEIAGTAAVIYGAGQEVTTTHMFAHGMYFLVNRPELQQELRKSPELIPNFVEETLRLEPPLKLMHRLAMVDIEIGGVEIPAGSTVALSWAAANRDPEYWSNPDEFDLHRRDWRRSRVFGSGAHACAGAPLARIEGCAGFERILARTRNLRHAHNAPPAEFVPSYFARMLKRLWVEWNWA